MTEKEWRAAMLADAEPTEIRDRAAKLLRDEYRRYLEGGPPCPPVNTWRERYDLFRSAVQRVKAGE